MSALLSVNVVDAAPGNILVLKGTGLAPGALANVTLDSQGVNAPPTLATSTITLVGFVFAADGSSVSIPIPDLVVNGRFVITAGDGSTATCNLRVASQYVQASEYIGEGTDTSGFAPGELDVILRRASSYADAYMGSGIRLLQTIERHKFRQQGDRPPKFYAWRSQGRRVPLLSIDQIVLRTSNSIVSKFNTQNDIYVNQDLGYVEILAYAIANYALLQALQIVGYSANVVELVATTGYSYSNTPQEVRDAVITIATELITYRAIQSRGLGGLSQVKQGSQSYQRRQEPFAIPAEAKDLLRPFIPKLLG